MIRVLVADDEPSLREAIGALLASEPGMEVVAAAATADEAIELAVRTSPDVALLDVRMPGGGAHAAREIRRRSPDTKVVALSAYDDQATVLELLAAGGVGYLVKGVAPSEVTEAVARAARGQASLPEEVIARAMAELAEDANGRRQALEVLRRSEQRFRGLLESAPDAVVIVDEAGAIAIVNAQAETLFGYGREELLGRPIEVLLPERFREAHVRNRAAYQLDPRTRPMGAGLELMARRRDGSEFSVDISLSAIDTDEGRLVTARIRDVTEDKREEDTLRKSDERFRALLESAPDAVVITDAEGRIVLVNVQTERMFGYGREELLGRPVERLLPERFQGRHVAHRGAYLAAPTARAMGVGLDLAGRRRDGSEFPVDISLATIETDEGPLVTAFIRDVTERLAREKLEADLAERRAMLAHLVAASEDERARIAGDIHDDSIQAITAAGMRLQILRRSLDDPAQLEMLGELEQTIQLSIARLRHLLFDLRPPVLDNEGLSAALEMYLGEAAAQSPARFELRDELRTQPVGETRTILYRIAQEALTNARKHAQAKTVAVSLHELDEGYLVRIADDGIGFDPAAATPVVGHLGLAAMRERATLAGGWVRIDSTQGAGTVVEVWVPEEAAVPPSVVA